MKIQKVINSFLPFEDKIIPPRNPLWLHNYIAGKWQDAVDEKWVPIPHPLTGEITHYIPRSDHQDVALVLAHLEQFKTGIDRVWPVENRAKSFELLHHRVAALKEELKAIIRHCFPKSDAEADGELVIMIELLKRLSDPENIRLLYTPLDSAPAYGYATRRETAFVPVGRGAIITPFNYPGEILGLQMWAALACGNAIVIKGHEYCGLMTQALLELTLDAGVPPEIINVIHGFGSELAQLVATKDIDRGVFTGSSAVANQIRQHGNGNWLFEQSGINWAWFEPMWPEANVRRVAIALVLGAFGLGKQRCSSTEWAFVHESWIVAGLFDHLECIINQLFKFGDGSLPVLMGGWPNEKVQATLDELETLKFKPLLRGVPVADFTYQPPSDAPVDRFRYGCITPSVYTLDLAYLATNPQVYHTRCVGLFFPVLKLVPIRNQSDRAAAMTFINGFTERLTCCYVTNKPWQAREFFQQVRCNGVTNIGPEPWTTKAEATKAFGPIGTDAAHIGGPLELIRHVWMSSVSWNEAMNGLQLPEVPFA